MSDELTLALLHRLRVAVLASGLMACSQAKPPAAVARSTATVGPAASPAPPRHTPINATATRTQTDTTATRTQTDATTVRTQIDTAAMRPQAVIEKTAKPLGNGWPRQPSPWPPRLMPDCDVRTRPTLPLDGQKAIAIPTNLGIARCLPPTKPTEGRDLGHVAALRRNDGWLLDRHEVAQLDEASRCQLASYYRNVGLREHASVAAFNRANLEVLALGAPSDLVLAHQRAAIDEITHARLAFTLATAYDGQDLGPGELVIPAVRRHDWLSLTLAVFDEACVPETMAALRASNIAHVCTAAEPFAFWSRVARDEARHAALAFRTLDWALAQMSSGERTCALRELAALRMDGPGLRISTPSLVCRDHGMLVDDEAGDIDQRALTVIHTLLEDLREVGETASQLT